MTYAMVHQPGSNNAQSPFRVIVQKTGRQVDWIARYLDQSCVRGLARHTLRSYALDLLHFVRWWADIHKTDDVTEEALTGSTLLDYVRFQAGQEPRPAADTINRRVWVVERALRNLFPDAAAQIAPGDVRVHIEHRLHVIRRTCDHLEDVARDLAIVGLMLLQGLRSCEVLSLNHDDLILAEAQIRVLGKGNKVRLLPLAPEAIELLDHYVRLERPVNCGSALFVSLKDRARGIRMTPEGLRSLFRHHRQTTGVTKANPHRFRHTFATDMIRAGISLPALMQLMGHAQIQTTLVYIRITPQDVYQQYARAVAQIIRPVPPSKS